MLASERLLEIEEKFDATVERIVPLELDGETLQLVLHLKDGTNLRVTEQFIIFFFELPAELIGCYFFNHFNPSSTDSNLAES